MKLLLVPRGEGLDRGAIIHHGTDYNIWVNHDTDETFGYQEIDEANAQLRGMAQRPGTLTPSMIDSVEAELNDRFGVGLGRELDEVPPDAPAVNPGPPETARDRLEETPALETDDEDFRMCFDIEQWNTPAGEPPKRRLLRDLL